MNSRATCRLVGAAALGFIVASTAIAAENRNKAMQDAAPLLDRMQSLRDAAFQAHDASSIPNLSFEALGSPFRGVLLSAPARVDSNAQTGLPALLLSVLSRQRLVAAPLPANAVALAVDLDSGLASAGPALPGPADKVPALNSPRGAVPGKTPLAKAQSPEEQQLKDELGHGTTAAQTWLDFRTVLHLPRVGASYQLRVIYFDEVSNPRRVDVAGPGAGPKGYPAEAARLFRAGQGMAEFPATRMRVGRLAQTPGLDGEGARLVAEPLVVAADGIQTLTLHGAMRLALTPGMTVTATVPPAEAAPEGRLPAAVIRATLLMVTLGRPNPLQVPIEIPIWPGRALHAAEVVDAAFAVDLTLPAGMALDNARLYLVAGPHLSSALSLRRP